MLTKWKSNPCENPSCQNRSWRARFRTSGGIKLQGRWHCEPECFEMALEQTLVRLAPAAMPRQVKKHRLPLGLLMLSEGWINEENLKAALNAQRSSKGVRIGEWFCRLGTATEHQITTALGIQWSRPVFSLGSTSNFLQYASLIPFPLLESFLMVPVHYLPQSRHIYIAFAVEIDYTVLYGVERMLNCSTEPCLAKQSSVEWALEQIRQRPRPTEILFDSIRDPKEMARATASYTAKLAAEDVRVARCGRYLWLQLRSPGQTGNLLFPILPQSDATLSSLHKVS